MSNLLGRPGLGARIGPPDWPSFLLGGSVGAAVAGLTAWFGLPDLSAVPTPTVTPEIVGVVGISLAAVVGLLPRPRARRTPLPAFRHSSPVHAATGAPTVPTVPDKDWEWMGAKTPVRGFPGEGYMLLRSHMADENLAAQLRLQTGDLAAALVDALLSVASGKVSCVALDDLAALAFDPNAARSRDGLWRFRRDLERAVPDLRDRRESLGDRHAFPSTRLLGALADARAVEIVPAADFAWLAREHWSLWLAAVCADSRTAYAECAGIVCHHRNEVAAGHAVETPATFEAARALAGYGKPDAEMREEAA